MRRLNGLGGRALCTTASRSGNRDCRLESFFSCKRMYASSSSASIFSALVTKYALR
jgi:hypothetical protein